MTKPDEDTKTLTIEEGQDGVAIVWMDVPGEPVNTLKPSFAEEYRRVFDDLASRQGLRAVVLASRKPSSWVAGADIKMLDALTDAEKARHLVTDGQQALDRLAAFSVPIVAAIHGACLGGGLELALACHGRVASDDPVTRLGLPEVRLGILPAAGGTQRLPRLIGAQAALDLILQGKQVRAQKALKLGLVDEVVPRAILVDVARQHALALASKPTLGRSRLKKGLSLDGLQSFFLEDTPVGRSILFSQARKKLLETTRGNYPAPEKALEAIRIGLSSGMEAGLRAEADFFAELGTSLSARNLMSIFFATTRLKKETGTDEPEAVARPIRKVGVLGAGFMGAGIALVTAENTDLVVRIKDRDGESLARGLSSIRKVLDERVRKKHLEARERDRILARVRATTDYSGFKQADVVIEAVFEDLELKRKVLAEVEDHGPPDVIFASNTSSIPISRIASASRHPETVIGMHYFSPVHKMPLLEVIVTDHTAPSVIRTCVELGRKQGKTVIVVRDGVGFYTTRILAPYGNEAGHLLAEGVRVEAVDDALMKYGFPVGPLALMDEVGIDVVHKVGAVVAEAFGERMQIPPGIDGFVALGRLGRKSGKGFYRYPSSGEKSPDSAVYADLKIERRKDLEAGEIAERCALQLLNEAARCYGEGILRSASDGDVGAIFGLGFPPFRGGPFREMNTLGAAKVIERLEHYRSIHGPRFEPAPVLRELSERNIGFFSPDAPPPGTFRDEAVAGGTSKA